MKLEFDKLTKLISRAGRSSSVNKNFYNHLPNYGVIKITLTYGWQCASWTCWVGVNTRFIFDIRSCFFFHTMFWRKKSVSLFIFCFTSRAKESGFPDKSWLAFDFHWWILLARHGSTGILLFEDTIIFQTNNNSFILFRIKWLISELLGFFWMYWPCRN